MKFHKSSFVGGNLCQLLICLHLLFSSCSSHQSSKEKNFQAHQVEQFLSTLLFEEGGIYTLWGDKPMTEILIYQGKDMVLEDVPEHLRERCELAEDCSLENLNAWNQFSEQLIFPKFRFVERPCPSSPYTSFFAFINIVETKKVFEKYQDRFKQVTQMDLSFDQALQELENPDSLFWQRAYKDHYLRGLLFGFGEENINYFLADRKGRRSSNSAEVFNEGLASPDDFPLPVYVCIDPKNDPTTLKYRQQRERIKRIYKNKNTVDVTLKELCR